MKNEMKKEVLDRSQQMNFWGIEYGLINYAQI